MTGTFVIAPHPDKFSLFVIRPYVYPDYFTRKQSKEKLRNLILAMTLEVSLPLSISCM